MSYRTQFLTFHAQKLGYIGQNITSSFDIDAFLQQKLSRQDSYYIYFLYLKHCLLSKAQEQRLISEPQKNMLWEKVTQQRTAPQLFCGEQNVISLAFYEQTVKTLTQQHVLSAVESQLFTSLVSAWQKNSATFVKTPSVVADDKTEILNSNATIADASQVGTNETIVSSFDVQAHSDATFSSAQGSPSPQDTIASLGLPSPNVTQFAKQHASVSSIKENPQDTVASLGAPHEPTPTNTNDFNVSTAGRAKATLESSDLFAGRYKIESELGRGGMGVVYKVYDNNLGRHVALKLVLAKNATEVQVRRFLKEAQVVAKLDHPNTIRIFDIGEFPQKYFTMEYIEGKTLSEYIKEKSLDFNAIAKIIHKVAQALQNAHRQNLIHRDIKPSNIMLDSAQQPRLMDFGLVKDADSDLSHEGDILGTPAYMSPEQAHGQQAVPGSDVYSLGATLYQALTGRAPFSGSSALNIIVQIMQKDPVPPRELNPDIPRELEAITLKCMEKKITKRYRSAYTLVKDLENYLQNRPITASPPTQFTYLKKWILRNKGVSITALLSFIVIFTTVSIFTYLQIRSSQQIKQDAQIIKKNNEKLQQKSEELTTVNSKLTTVNDQLQTVNGELKNINNELQKNTYNANIALAALRIENVNVSGARESLDKCPAHLRNWEWKWLHKTLKIDHVSFGKSRYLSCSFHPNKKVFVAGANDYLQLWDTSNPQQPMWTVPAVKGKITNCCFSQNGKWILVSTNKNDPNRNRLYGKPVKNMYLVDSATGKTIHTYEGHAYAVKQSTFSHDGRYIISSGDDACIKIWKATQKTTKPIQTIDLLAKIKQTINETGFGQQSLESIKNYKISSCALNKDNQYIIAARDDRLMLWRKKQRKYTLIDESSYSLDFKRNCGGINHCVFHPVYNTIIVATKNGNIDLWSITNGKLHFVRSLEKAHKLDVIHCCFSRDGKKMLSSGRDTNVALWEVDTATYIFVSTKYYGHTQKITYCDFSADGSSFISAADSVKLWKMDEELRPTRLSKKHIGLMERRGDFAKTDKHSHLFASAGDDGLKIWDWHQRKLHKVLAKNRKFYQCVYHPHKNLVATTDKKPDYLQNPLNNLCEVTLWDIDTGKSRVISTHKRGIRFCSFSDDGRYLASIGKRIKIFDFENNREFELRHSHKSGMRWCGFAPKNNNLFVSAAEKIIIWDIEKREELHSFTENIYKIHFADFHPTTTIPILITADSRITGIDQDVSLSLWDLENKEFLKKIPGSKSNINCCVFDRTGQRIMTMGKDHALRIWHFEWKNKEKSIAWKSQELLTLRKHKSSIYHGSLSPDNSALISMSEDGEMYLWNTK